MAFTKRADRTVSIGSIYGAAKNLVYVSIDTVNNVAETGYRASHLLDDTSEKWFEGIAADRAEALDTKLDEIAERKKQRDAKAA